MESLISYTDLPEEYYGDVSKLLQSSPADAIDNIGKIISKDSDIDALPNIAPKEVESFERIVDRRYDRKLPLRPRKISPIIASTQAAELRDDTLKVDNPVRKLAEDLKSTSSEVVREATCKIRHLSKESGNRILIASCGAITSLVDLLHSLDPLTQEFAVTSLLNLSIHDNTNTTIVNDKAIDALIHVLQTGTPVAKENSAATLFSLSSYKEIKIQIANSGAIPPLVELLGSGTPRGKKDAANALYNLSTCSENRAEIVRLGAVKHLINLMDPATGIVDRAIVILANLASSPEGRISIVQAGGIPRLVEAIELSSARGKEYAAAALLHLCSNSNRYSMRVLEEGAMPPLVVLSKSGTPRAREKAMKLVEHFRSLQRARKG